MSHQKVSAKDKWVFYEMHPERINWLLEGLEEVEIKRAEVYEEILERWKDGDFSQADKDHNTVWNILGGTKGEANGLLSEREEQRFIKKSYK